MVSNGPKADLRVDVRQLQVFANLAGGAVRCGVGVAQKQSKLFAAVVATMSVGRFRLAVITAATRRKYCRRSVAVSL
jgi:hypothetical protein